MTGESIAMTMDRGTYSGLTVGAPVVTMDGDQIGSVKEIRGRYFKVDAPMQPDYWLSLDNVGAGSGGQVVLGFNKDRLGDYQLSSPDEVDTDTGRLTDYRADTRTMTDRTAPYDDDHVATATAAAATHSTDDMPATDVRRADVDTDEQRRLRLHEERLRANKETVEAGEVGLRKEVVSEQQTIDVPVRREEVYIERRPGSGAVTDEEIGEDEEIRIPVHEERVNVDKETVVTGEVSLGKRTVQETRRVSDTVRREEAHIEKDGDIEVHGDETNVRPS
jgi:uncharacterized protein (TIGR02271 family)